MRPPVAANGWPAASEPPLTLSLPRSIAPSGSSRPRRSRAEDRVLPGARACRAPARRTPRGSRRGRSPASVEAVAVEHARHRVGGRHQQALAAVDVVDRGGLGRRRSTRGPAGRAPSPTPRSRAAPPRRRRTAASSCRRSSCPSRAAEDRLELGELLERRVGAQVLVALEAEVRRDEVVEEAALVGGGEVAGGCARASSSCASRVMPHSSRRARRCSPIERPVRGSSLRGIAGTMWPGPHARRAASARPGVDFSRLASSRISRRSSLSAERRVGGGVDAAGDAGLDLAERDLVGDEDRRLEAGAARLLDVVRGRLGREAAAEHALARQVEVAAVLEHGAGDDLAEPLAAAGRSGSTSPSSAAVSMSWLEACA